MNNYLLLIYQLYLYIITEINKIGKIKKIKKINFLLKFHIYKILK